MCRPCFHCCFWCYIVNFSLQDSDTNSDLPVIAPQTENPTPKQSRQMRYVDIVKCEPPPRKLSPEGVVTRSDSNATVSSSNSCHVIREQQQKPSGTAACASRSSSAPAQHHPQVSPTGGHNSKYYTHSRYTSKRRRNVVGAKHSTGSSNNSGGKTAR